MMKWTVLAAHAKQATPEVHVPTVGFKAFVAYILARVYMCLNRQRRQGFNLLFVQNTNVRLYIYESVRSLMRDGTFSRWVDKNTKQFII